jgi:hypothetical protein
MLLTCLLAGCSSQTIKLDTYDQSYHQFKHIIDNRYDGSVSSDGRVHTEGDRILKHLGNLSKAVAAGPYAAGTVDIDQDMLLVSESKFSIPPALALDMALNQFANQGNKTISKIKLTAFSIRSQYLFLGIPDSASDAKCNIYANYRDAKLWSTQTTTFGFNDYNEKMAQLVDKCINGIIDRVIYHEKRLLKEK